MKEQTISIFISSFLSSFRYQAYKRNDDPILEIKAIDEDSLNAIDCNNVRTQTIAFEMNLSGGKCKLIYQKLRTLGKLITHRVFSGNGDYLLYRCDLFGKGGV